MITSEQEKWLSHLSSTNSTKIYPYDPSVEKKFEIFKERVQKLLGPQHEIVHKGASSLGISGQGELDIYVPVEVRDFDEVLSILSQEFGKPGSFYPLKRARFNSDVEGTKVELFVINKEDRGWIDSCSFEDYLKTHPEALEEYEVLKEEGARLSTQEYYRRKTEFINEILAKIDTGRGKL